MELVPRRRHDFSSLARAQFWFEWRRSGWLLPVCAAFVLTVIFFPISWFWRRDASYGDYIFGRLLAMPLFLALLIGKAFVKCDFWSPRLALPQFLAVRPMSAEQFVAAKLKVAAWSVAISWLLVLIFTVSWLCGWANTKQLHQELFTLRAFFPRAWPLFAVSALAVLMVLTWRCLISGLWAGLSGNLFRYTGSITAQVMVPAMVLLAIGIWSDQIDQLLQKHPQLMKPLSSQALGWVMALLVIARVWFAFAFWKKTSERLTHQYLLTWLVATLAFLAVAFLFRPPFDTYRESHLYLLAALLIFPLARPGLASYAFSLNRHR